MDVPQIPTPLALFGFCLRIIVTFRHFVSPPLSEIFSFAPSRHSLSPLIHSLGALVPPLTLLLWAPASSSSSHFILAASRRSYRPLRHATTLRSLATTFSPHRTPCGSLTSFAHSVTSLHYVPSLAQRFFRPLRLATTFVPSLAFLTVLMPPWGGTQLRRFRGTTLRHFCRLHPFRSSSVLIPAVPVRNTPDFCHPFRPDRHTRSHPAMLTHPLLHC